MVFNVLIEKNSLLILPCFYGKFSNRVLNIIKLNIIIFFQLINNVNSVSYVPVSALVSDILCRNTTFNGSTSSNENAEIIGRFKPRNEVFRDNTTLTSILEHGTNK